MAVDGSVGQPVTGAAERQTLLPGSFTGPGQAELAIVRVQTAGERRVRMYGFDGDGWTTVRETRLDPEVLFVDVASRVGTTWSPTDTAA